MPLKKLKNFIHICQNDKIKNALLYARFRYSPILFFTHPVYVPTKGRIGCLSPLKYLKV